MSHLRKLKTQFKRNIPEKLYFLTTLSVENLKEQDILSSATLREDGNLGIHAFFDNSLVNYLHQLGPSLTVDQLLKNGNYQFSFYVDGRMIYKENLNTGAGTAENKKLKTSFRIPLISSSNEDSWGRYLWMRFYLLHDGIDALSSGNHILKIEIRPYLKTTTLQTGEIIAEGEIKMNVPEKNIPERLTAIQPIQPNSGWEVSRKK